MEPVDTKTLSATCTRVARLVEGLEEKVLRWAENKEKLYKSFSKELEKFPTIEDSLTEEWLEVTANQYAAGKIMSSTERLKKFFNHYRNVLVREEKELLRHFLERPWFYTFFSVQDVLGDHIMRIFDYSSHDTFLLSSPAVEQMVQQGASSFCCLLFDDGSCLQTFGGIQYFYGFREADFRGFAEFAGPYYAKTGDLSGVIGLNPVPFLMLQRFSTLPMEEINGELIEICAHSLPVAHFEPADYQEVFNMVEKEGAVMGRLKGQAGEDDQERILFDKTAGVLHVVAVGIETYRQLIARLKDMKDRYDFPMEPSWRKSPNLELAFSTILDIKPPMYDVSRLFEEYETLDPATEEEGDRLEQLSEEIYRFHRDQITYSAEVLAQKWNFPVAVVLELQQFYTLAMPQLDMIKSGGFQNFMRPTLTEREFFRASFADNHVLHLHWTRKAKEYFAIIREGFKKLSTKENARLLTLEELPGFLDEMVFDFWPKGESSESSILLYTMYLLGQRGKQFLKVRDYAVEVLREFDLADLTHLVQHGTERAIEEFIETYADFCHQILKGVGLIETDMELDEASAKKATYQLKATPFFYEWIRFGGCHGH